MVEEMKMLTGVKWAAVRCIVLLVACVGIVRATGGDIFYFSSWPASGRVGAGEERVLRCAVSDTTSISLAWHLDGRLLTYTSRRHLRGGQRVETASDLVIRRAVPEDQGEYNCIAHNTTSGFALTSLPATLTVLWVAEESRVVLADPKDLSTVRPGSSLKLRCRVDGGPELYYSWRRNGEALAEVAGFTLSRRKLTISTFDAASHNGVYTCAATIYKHSGALHQSVRPAYLTSTTAHIPFILSIHDTGVPSVVVVPESVVVGPGRRAALHCSYEDHTTILWYLQDSGPLTNTSRHQVLTNGTVVIWAATLGDEGVYRCEGVHPYRAHRASYAASLTLAYLDTHSPPVLEPDATIRNTHVVGLGGRLRVVCLPPAGLPHPQVSWETPHLLEDSSFRVEGAALLVEDATFAQAGNYTCVASNLAGNTSVSLQLVVTRKPEAQLVTSRVSVLEEETARLECRVDASPRPFTNVSWIRNNNPVSVDDYRVMVTGMEDEMTEGVSVLRIRWVRLQDEGLYACVVITAGHPPLQTPPIKLTVTERLKFAPLPHDVRVEVGANISIPCEARGADSPIITWHHVSANKLVDVGKKENMLSVDGRLEVAGAELKDSGQYMCVAASIQGSINTTISLTVIESPVLEWVTQGPVQVDKGGTLVLECHARGSPRPSIHWDYNHTTNALDLERVEVHGNGTLQLTGVRQEDGGVYGCTAGNMGGLVRAEISVTITGESSQLLGRTVGVAVGGAAAYMALVGAMLIYCRQRRQRLKHTPQHIRGDGNEEAQNPEEQEKLVYSAPPGGSGDQDTRDVGTGTTITGSRMDTSCQVQLSQVSTHTLGTSTHLGLSQASTRTLGGSSISTQHSSPLQPNSSPSAQSAIHAGPSENMYVKPESNHAGNPLSHDNSIIQRENLQVLLTLGRGEFGDVQLARLRTSSEECDGEDAPPDPEALVMVKVVSTRDEALLAEVCREAAMFGGPSHINVVTTLGLCTSHTPHLLVTQYTDWGDMKQFLLATRKESPRPLGSLRPPPLTHTQCLNLSLQVAEGLEYLSGRRHTHRDVAARNCLITSTLQVKLASPALTRDAYAAEYCTYRNQVLPVRWLAQEALMEEEYSMKSSVFSWAWLVWEVLTQAAIPHSHLSDHQVIASSERGELECTAPPRTPADLESLLAGCWQLSPKARPSIHTVVDTLKAMT
ncbi:inactive tyrosine-protein kinase 7-like isoform X2 [Homarus americanus]|uniref:inactive tyrosine-protein kinase 7-like isoform X2 n=1 Tax=Homarus americanus TaxID=6706 RepID=UPI001C458577|nr:inactive tyrosine-protein kinase 7-like isoform X2 [Homarus americanus]